MTSGDVVLAIVVGTAVTFDFTNGFHDAANVVATSTSTRAIGPRRAIALASILNFARSLHLAQGGGDDRQGLRGVRGGDHDGRFRGPRGCDRLNLVTWFYGLASSSSHALSEG
jgi:PiT family inorganic phosphate transporter